jgi:hypothetical protein
MKPPKHRHEKYFDAGTKLHVAFDLSYIKYKYFYNQQNQKNYFCLFQIFSCTCFSISNFRCFMS